MSEISYSIHKMSEVTVLIERIVSSIVDNLFESEIKSNIDIFEEQIQKLRIRLATEKFKRLYLMDNNKELSRVSNLVVSPVYELSRERERRGRFVLRVDYNRSFNITQYGELKISYEYTSRSHDKYYISYTYSVLDTTIPADGIRDDKFEIDSTLIVEKDDTVDCAQRKEVDFEYIWSEEEDDNYYYTSELEKGWPRTAGCIENGKPSFKYDDEDGNWGYVLEKFFEKIKFSLYEEYTENTDKFMKLVQNLLDKE